MKRISISLKQANLTLLSGGIGTIFILLLLIQSPNFTGNSKDNGKELFEDYIVTTLDSSAMNGKILFQNQCGACHATNMKIDLTGPALGGVENRWSQYEKEELYQWIRNSQKMIRDQHPKAIELWGRWSPAIMNSFPNLTDKDIEDILSYIQKKTP